MYNKNSRTDWLGAAVMAGLGAGVVTSIAVSMGQDPVIAASITLFAIAGSLLLDRVI
ncbi:MAG: hypothetical protein AAGF66_05615 [Cyanobacteria bacterium P01_H01_bin.119]